MKRYSPSPQSGNALWFILITIVILGGLTILMSRSSGTSDDAGDYERNQINVSETARYAKSVEVAVQSLKNQGCSENEINFDTPEIAGYDNTNAPDDESCNIFSDKGGGIAYRRVQPLFLDGTNSGETLYGHWVFNGGLNIPNVGSDGNGARSKELLMIAPFLTKEFCMAINSFLGRPNDADAPPEEAGTTKANFLAQFTGSFANTGVIDGSGNMVGNTFNYKSSGCTKASDSGYYFFQVLIAR